MAAAAGTAECNAENGDSHTVVEANARISIQWNTMMKGDGVKLFRFSAILIDVRIIYLKFSNYHGQMHLEDN